MVWLVVLPGLSKVKLRHRNRTDPTGKKVKVKVEAKVVKKGESCFGLE